jgi:hypothetical protein
MLLKKEKKHQRRIRAMNKINKYKKYNPDGSVRTYQRDDVVNWRGDVFVATKTISGYEPGDGEDHGWKIIDDKESINHSSRNTAPPNPKDGDEWLDTSTGLLMKYIDDGFNKQWVEF